MDHPVLINPFEVAARDDDEFLKGWNLAAEYMRAQPGFISSRLHRAMSPEARFGFVNVAEWESPEHFRSAVSTAEFQRLAGHGPPSFPSLYQVVKSL